MAKIIFRAWEASCEFAGFTTVHLDIGGTGPFAGLSKTVECKNCAEIEKELAIYAAAIEAHAISIGKGARCFPSLARGERAPNGFKARQWDRDVNIKRERAA